MSAFGAGGAAHLHSMPDSALPSAAPHSRLRPAVRIALALVLFFAAAGFLYENISEARDRRFNPMPGRLVDVRGLKMHIDCTGEGSPAVILETGLGDSYYAWRKVQPDIAKFARVCSYDRAGLGYSDSTSQSRTSKVIAEQLHALLQAAGVAPPYILVGHSMGGFNVRLYTSLYPNEVAGLLLLDSSHPEQESRFPRALGDMQRGWENQAKFLEYGLLLGIPRLLSLCDNDPVQRAAECNFHSGRERVKEMQAFSESATEAAASGSLGDLPLTVISHDPDKGSNDLPPDLAQATNAAWEKMQEDLTHLSTRGTRTIAKNSSHYIQVDRPDMVVDAVRTLVDASRHARQH